MFSLCCVTDKNDPQRIELYGRVSLLIIIVWAIYPFVWLLSVGMHAMGVSLVSFRASLLLKIFSTLISF